MATSEDNDVASRQLGWLRKVREAVNLTGPPPPEVLRCLAPPSEDDVSQEDGKTASSERQKEPISPLSPKVVEELASLHWELQERQRTVSSLEELVDLLQTRCRELEDESRELVDLAASKHEQEQLEAGVPHERRDEDDYIATIKERQLSREPIPPLGRSSIRSNLSSERDLEMERLKLRCEELEEERRGLEMQLEESKAQGSSLAATLKQSGINVAGAKGNDSESEDAEKDWSREDLEARCLRLEAEKEKLQKHVERLWQMCEALDASAKPEEQQLQGRQGSLEELNFEAVVERAVSMKATERQQLARAEAEKAELQELAEALTAQVQALQERLRSEDQEVSIGAVARCEDLTRQKAELEKELGELATAYAKLQGNLNAEKRLRLEAEEALQLERKALEEAQALEDRGVQSEPKKVAEREAEPESNLEALRQELAALAAERDQLRSKVSSRVPKAVETQLQHAEAAVEEQMQRVTQAEAVAEEQKQLRFQAEAELEEQALLKRRLEASLEEETHLRSKAEAQLAEQIQLRSQAEAYLDAERLAREEVLRRSLETSRASTTTQEELQKQAEALAIETEKCRVLEQQNAGLQEEMAQLVETQRTLEATSAIKLEGLQEKYNELQAQQVSSDQAERSASLEKEVASLRKQIEEMVSEQAMSEELLGTDTVEELKADIVKLTEEQGRLEAECERRNAQKEELVLQLEEALRAETRKTEELKEMQQKLRGAEEAKEEVDGKAASLRQQLQCAQAEGDMLSNELQKLGQQLQDAQAKAVSLQDEYDLLRGRYETLEADHTDLGLRAEEALAGHQALTAEHQRVVDQAKHLQQRHSAEDEDSVLMGTRVARSTFMLVITLVFCSICPVVLLAAAVYFLIERLSHGYLMLSAEPRQGDAGGELFVQALKQVHTGLLIYVLLMIGVLGSNGFEFGLLLVPILFMVSWSLLSLESFLWPCLPLNQVMDLDDRDPPMTDATEVYEQLECREEIVQIVPQIVVSGASLTEAAVAAAAPTVAPPAMPAMPPAAATSTTTTAAATRGGGKAPEETGTASQEAEDLEF